MRGPAATALSAAALLLLGALVGLSAVWTHGRWWALALGAGATLAAELAAPRGLLRLAYAGGWIAAAAYFLLTRPEGDFVVASDALGYTFLGLALLVLARAVATAAPRGRTRPTMSGGAGPTA